MIRQYLPNKNEIAIVSKNLKFWELNKALGALYNPKGGDLTTAPLAMVSPMFFISPTV